LNDRDVEADAAAVQERRIIRVADIYQLVAAAKREVECGLDVVSGCADVARQVITRAARKQGETCPSTGIENPAGDVAPRAVAA
jgi:hypothetical protein